MDFETSTQRRHWTYGGLAEVHEQRRVAREAARQSFTDAGFLDTDLLTVEHERVCVLYYRYIVATVADLLSLSTVVKHTALAFFNRFYLKNNLALHTPDVVVVACLYLAAKVEDERRAVRFYLNFAIPAAVDAGAEASADADAAGATTPATATASTTAAGGVARVLTALDRATLAQVKGTQVNDVLYCERRLVSTLRFNLRVYHPFDAVRGLLVDMGRASPTYFAAVDMIDVLERAYTLVKASYYTDVCFICTPSQLALYAILGAFKQLYVRNGIDEDVDAAVVDRYIGATFKKVPVEQVREKMRGVQSVLDGVFERDCAAVPQLLSQLVYAQGDVFQVMRFCRRSTRSDDGGGGGGDDDDDDDDGDDGTTAANDDDEREVVRQVQLEEAIAAARREHADAADAAQATLTEALRVLAKLNVHTQT